MSEWIVQTYEGDMLIEADTCVVQEWFLCARAKKERDLKVVK